MKKFIYFVLIFSTAALWCFSLSSCKKQEESNKKEKIRLEFYNRKRESYAALEKIINKFNKSQDEIEPMLIQLLELRLLRGIFQI